VTLQTQKLWAMEPQRLAAFFRDMKGRGQPDATMAALATASGQEERLYERAGSLAIVSMAGPLAKNGNRWLGISSMRQIGAALVHAAQDPAVRAILLDVDSPGGTVDGTEELAGIAWAVGAQKPLYTYASDLMCSAAYWVGSQSREIGIQASAQIGSIGVVLTHTDWSGRDEQMGVDVTYLTAGKYKAMGNPDEPLSDEARVYLQESLDQVYGLFLDAVAQGRKVDRAAAEAMADGRVFLGRQALELGLVDRIESRADFINHIVQEVHMDLAKFKAEHSGVAAEHRAEVENELSAKYADAIQAAVDSERGRCLGVMAALMGKEMGDKVAALVATGITAEQATAMGAFLPQAPAASGQAEQSGNAGLIPSDHIPLSEAGKAALGALAGAAQSPLSPAADPTAAAPDFDALVAAEEAKGLSKGQALGNVVKAHPKAHAAWLKKHNERGGE